MALVPGPLNSFDPTSSGWDYTCVKVTDSRYVVAYMDWLNLSGKIRIAQVVGDETTFYDYDTFSDVSILNGSNITLLSATVGIVCYSTVTDSSYGVAKLFVINGNSVTVLDASKKVFTSTAVANDPECMKVLGISGTKAIVFYTDMGDAGKGYCCILTNDGTGRLTATTPVKFADSSILMSLTSAVLVSSSAAVVVYQDVGNFDYATACCISFDVSTDVITPEAPVPFNGSAVFFVSVAFLEAGKLIAAYEDVGNASQGTAIVLVLTGVTITFGAERIYNTGISSRNSLCALSDSRALVADGQDDLTGEAYELTIAGTTITVASYREFFATVTDSAALVMINDAQALCVFGEDSVASAPKAKVLSFQAATAEFTFEMIPAGTVYNHWSTQDWIKEPHKTIYLCTLGNGNRRVPMESLSVSIIKSGSYYDSEGIEQTADYLISTNSSHPAYPNYWSALSPYLFAGQAIRFYKGVRFDGGDFDGMEILWLIAYSVVETFTISQSVEMPTLTIGSLWRWDGAPEAKTLEHASVVTVGEKTTIEGVLEIEAGKTFVFPQPDDTLTYGTANITVESVEISINLAGETATYRGA